MSTTNDVKVKSWVDCKVAIAVTCNTDKMDTPLLFNIMAMAKPNECIVTHQGKHIKSASLNSQVNLAYDNHCSHILFLDADMEFPVDAIPKLLSCNVPIVSGLYHTKTYPFSPIAGWNVDGDKDKKVNGRGKPWKYDYFPLPEDQLVEVDWAGIGCLLVNMDVFNKIYFPCFNDEWDSEKGCRKNGHDIVFFDTVKKAGYHVYVDTSVQCSHRTVFNIDKLFVDAWHKSNIVEVTKELVKGRKITLPGHENRQKPYEEAELAQLVFQAEEKGPDDPIYWDARWMTDLAERRVVSRNDIVKSILEVVPEGATVGEFGCGYTTTMAVLRDKKGCKVYGYDWSPEAIRLMKENFNLDGEVIDLRTYVPNGKTYHTTVLSHVLEHFNSADVHTVLETLRSMTEYQCIIAVPQENPEGIKGTAIGGILELEHKHIYTPETLRELLEKYFDVTDIKEVKPREEEKDYWVNRNLIARCLKRNKESDEVNLDHNGVSVGAQRQS